MVQYGEWFFAPKRKVKTALIHRKVIRKQATEVKPKYKKKMIKSIKLIKEK